MFDTVKYGDHFRLLQTHKNNFNQHPYFSIIVHIL
jgi:hypothetical protein